MTAATGFRRSAPGTYVAHTQVRGDKNKIATVVSEKPLGNIGGAHFHTCNTRNIE